MHLIRAKITFSEFALRMQLVAHNGSQLLGDLIFFFCLFLGFDLSLILLFTVGPICCAEKIEEPKINLPRQLNKRIKVPVNDKIHLSVPFQGDKPINTKPHHV